MDDRRNPGALQATIRSVTPLQRQRDDSLAWPDFDSGFANRPVGERVRSRVISSNEIQTDAIYAARLNPSGGGGGSVGTQSGCADMKESPPSPVSLGVAVRAAKCQSSPTVASRFICSRLIQLKENTTAVDTIAHSLSDSIYANVFSGPALVVFC